MKYFLLLLLGCFMATSAVAQVPPPAPATAADIAAGTATYKFISPAALAAAGIGSPTNGVSAATATNIAQTVAQTVAMANTNFNVLTVTNAGATVTNKFSANVYVARSIGAPTANITTLNAGNVYSLGFLSGVSLSANTAYWSVGNTGDAWEQFGGSGADDSIYFADQNAADGNTLQLSNNLLVVTGTLNASTFVGNGAGVTNTAVVSLGTNGTAYANGQVPTWNSSFSTFQPATPSGGGGGGNVSSNTAVAFTTVTANSVTASNLYGGGLGITTLNGSYTSPILYPTGNQDMGLAYNLSGQYGTVSSGYFGQTFIAYAANSMVLTNFEAYAGGISNGVTGFLTLILTNSLPTSGFTVNPAAPNVLYSAAVNIPLATNQVTLNFPIPNLIIPTNEFVIGCLTTSISNNLFAQYYNGNPGGLNNLDGGRYPYWAASTTNNFSVRYALATNGVVQAGWSARLWGNQLGNPSTASITSLNPAYLDTGAKTVQQQFNLLSCSITSSNTAHWAFGDSIENLFCVYGYTNQTAPYVQISSNAVAWYNSMPLYNVSVPGTTTAFMSNVWTTNYATITNELAMGTNVYISMKTLTNDRFITTSSNSIFTLAGCLTSMRAAGNVSYPGVVNKGQMFIVLYDCPTAADGQSLSNNDQVVWTADVNHWIANVGCTFVDRVIPLSQIMSDTTDTNVSTDTTHPTTIGTYMCQKIVNAEYQQVISRTRIPYSDQMGRTVTGGWAADIGITNSSQHLFGLHIYPDPLGLFAISYSPVFYAGTCGPNGRNSYSGMAGGFMLPQTTNGYPQSMIAPYSATSTNILLINTNGQLAEVYSNTSSSQVTLPILTQGTTAFYTNLVGGQFYTNTSTHAYQVYSPVFTLPASVAGNCEVDFKVGFTAATAASIASRTGGNTVIGMLAETNTDTLVGFVPSGGYWVVTNNVSGTGNSAGIDPSATNTIVIMP